MIYDPCASACQPTCAGENGDDCKFTCEEVCKCTDGLLLDGDECVPEADCGCTLPSGSYIKVQATADVIYICIHKSIHSINFISTIMEYTLMLLSKAFVMYLKINSLNIYVENRQLHKKDTVNNVVSIVSIFNT